MPNLSSIHDTFIRAILANKAIAADYFGSSLPVHVKDRLDFSTLTQLPDTYVSEDLQKSISDIVYSCERRDGKGKVKISLLLEHKSSPYRFTPIQLGNYIFSGLLKQVTNKEEPSLIIPVLLYHGRKQWKYVTLTDLFKGLDSEWRQFLPHYEYVYHHLGEISDEAIEALNNKFLAASFLALKYSLAKDELAKWIPKILSLVQESDPNLQNNLIVYTFERSGLDKERILAILQTLPESIKTTVMSTADVFRREGRQEGRLEERDKLIRNLLRIADLTDNQIAAAAEVSVRYVSRIRQGMNGEHSFPGR